MAVDVRSDILVSPRISFSHDLDNQDADPDIEAAQKYIKGSAPVASVDSESESDFLFSIISPSKYLHEPCLADEIFCNGKILPTQIKKKSLLCTNQHNSTIAQPSVVAEPRKVMLKELLECEAEDDDKERKPSRTKSFWQLRRSSSLNCESGNANGLIKSIQFLSKSKSTGSIPNPKQSRITRTSQKQNLQTQQRAGVNNLEKSQFHYYRYGVSRQKPPLGRTRSYDSSNVRISPVLNMPPPPSYFCEGMLVCSDWAPFCAPAKIRVTKRSHYADQ